MITLELRASLKKQTLCPACNVSWTELEDSLHEPMASLNWYEALMIIRNCKACSLRFEREEICQYHQS